MESPHPGTLTILLIFGLVHSVVTATMAPQENDFNVLQPCTVYLCMMKKRDIQCFASAT